MLFLHGCLQELEQYGPQVTAEPGTQGPKWRRVTTVESGAYPDARIVNVSLSCMHCGKPACMAVCPAGAISKRTEDGIVVVDRTSALVVTLVPPPARLACLNTGRTAQCRNATTAWTESQKDGSLHAWRVVRQGLCAPVRWMSCPNWPVKAARRLVAASDPSVWIGK